MRKLFVFALMLLFASNLFAQDNAIKVVASSSKTYSKNIILEHLSRVVFVNEEGEKATFFHLKVPGSSTINVRGYKIPDKIISKIRNNKK